MLTLGIDTATKVCALGFVDKGRSLATCEINRGHTHAEGLVPYLAQLCEQSAIARKDIELISISQGPGSFTGLRIGLATAEALAYSLNIPLVGVNTLEAIAYNLPVKGVNLAPILDAQKGNCYLAVYKWQEEGLTTVREVSIVPRREVGSILAQLADSSLIMGETQLIKGELPPMVSLAPEYCALPRGATVAALGEEQYLRAGAPPYFGLSPYYIRRSEAEELWEQKQKNTK